MMTNARLFVVVTVFLLATAGCSSPGSTTGICVPGGACAARYSQAQILEDATLDEYVLESIPNLSGNMGLGNLSPATTCEAAAFSDSRDVMEREINMAMADAEWENQIAWGYHTSVWRKDETYAYYQSYDATSPREDFILEKIALPQEALGGAQFVLITCAFQQ